MANSAWIYGNIADDVVPVGTTDTAGFVAANAVDNIPQTYAKSAGTGYTLTWNQVTAKTISGIAFINHNIIATGTQDLEFDTTSTFTPDAHVHLSMVASTDCYTSFSPLTYQYIRTINNVSTGLVQIGEVFMGTYFSPAQDFAPVYKETFKIHRVADSINGQMFYRNRTRQYGWQIKYNQLTAAEYLQFEAMMTGGHCIFVPDTAVNLCYHGGIQSTEGSLEKNVDYNVSGGLRSLSINFWQNALYQE
jgi:hypothetical protein